MCTTEPIGRVGDLIGANEETAVEDTKEKATAESDASKRANEVASPVSDGSKRPRVAEEGVRVMASYALATGGSLKCSAGSVVTFSGDAIVNAANAGCQGGGGVDGAISAAGGPSLAEARWKLPTVGENGARCVVGDAVSTVGGELRAKWCIHAVGPNYHELDEVADAWEGDKLLAATYASALKRARELECATLAFALLSAGIYKGSRSLDHVLAIAVEAVFRHAYQGLEEVHLVAFTRAEQESLLQAAAAFFAKGKAPQEERPDEGTGAATEAPAASAVGP